MKASHIGVLKYPFLIIVIWLMVFIARLIPLGGEWVELDEFTWLIVFLWAVVYFFSMLLGIYSGTYRKTNSNSLPSNWQNYWIRRLSYISIIGAILIIYEFAISRGYGFFTPVEVIRFMEVDAVSSGRSVSWVSGAGRILTPALLVAWVLAVLGWSEVRRRTFIILSLASAVVFYQQVMFEGGRFYLAALLLMMFIAKMFVSGTQSQKREFIQKPILWIGLFIFVCFAFGIIFIERYEQDGRIFSEAYETWAANFDLEVNDNVRSRLSGNMPGVWLSIHMLWAYVTQGVNELNALLLSHQPDLAWGRMQFPQIQQALGKLSGWNLEYDQVENLPKVGTYNTLYGASYIDFGHIGALIFIGIVGWLTGYAIKLLYTKKISGLAINAPLLIALGVFSPIVSLVVNLWPAFCWALLVGVTFRGYIYQLTPRITSD